MLNRRTILPAMAAICVACAGIAATGCQDTSGDLGSVIPRSQTKPSGGTKAGVSTLTVRIPGYFSVLRRVQADITAISTVDIAVTAPNYSASQAIGSADLASDGASVSAAFEAVPLGTALATVTAVDAASSTIGIASGSVAVVSGQPANLEIALPLALVQKNPPTWYTVTSIGDGTPGYADGPAASAKINGPGFLTVDSAGNVYFGDSDNRIRKVTSTGAVSTLCGNGVAGFADGRCAAAEFNGPDVAVDASGNLFVADAGNYRIRKITPAGVVTTIAGNGTAGFANGPGASAEFLTPDGIAVDGAGNIYVADPRNNQIRKITPAGFVTTFAGSQGDLATLYQPAGVAVDTGGNVYVGDYGNNAIHRISSTGVITTIAGSGGSSFLDGPASFAQFSSPLGVAVDAYWNVFVSDHGDARIREITSAGIVRTLAGDGTSGFADGPGLSAEFSTPNGIAVDSAGNIYVSDSTGNRIRKLTPN